MTPRLPANWTLDGPTTTAKGSRYYVATGRVEGRHSDRELTLVVFRPSGGVAWKLTRTGRKRGTLYRGRRDWALDALAEETERLNDEWAAIDGFEVSA